MTTLFWLLVLAIRVLGGSDDSLLVLAAAEEEDVAADECTFCASGEPITKPDRKIELIGLEFLGTCGVVDEYVLPTISADECQDLTSVLGHYCGCPLRENACTLCTDGSPVPEAYRSQELPWLTTAFGGVAPTCEFLESYLLTSAVAGEDACTSLQITNDACGCPALEDHCVYCPDENATLRPEYADVVLPFASNNELGVIGTCEIYWHSQYQLHQDDIQCQQSSFLTFHCGCNDGLLGYWGTTSTTQEVYMAWIPRVVGLLSLVASCLVQFHILRDKKKRLTVYHQLVVLITIFDMCTALVFIVGAAAVEEINPETGLTNGIYGAYGNDASCKASGFFYHLGFTSIYLNVSLMAYFVLVIVYSVRETKLRSLRRYLYTLPLLLGFALSLASIPFTAISWNHCQADNNPWGDTLWSLLVFHVIPLVGATTLIFGLLVFLYCRVRRQMQKTRDTKLRTFRTISSPGEQTSSASLRPTKQRRSSITRAAAAVAHRNKKDNLERQVFWICVSYTTAFAITWPILMVGQFQGLNFELPFWFWVIVVTVSPAQGIGNAYCYFRPQLVKWVVSKNKKGCAWILVCCMCGRNNPSTNDEAGQGNAQGATMDLSIADQLANLEELKYLRSVESSADESLGPFA